MKRFRFSLETVHNLREARRDEAERELGQATAAVVKAQEHISLIEDTRTSIEATIANTTGPIDTNDLSLKLGYLEMLEQRQRAATAELQQVEHARETSLSRPRSRSHRAVAYASARSVRSRNRAR
jgi:flagellar export protein FliJ